MEIRCLLATIDGGNKSKKMGQPDPGLIMATSAFGLVGIDHYFGYVGAKLFCVVYSFCQLMAYCSCLQQCSMFVPCQLLLNTCLFICVGQFLCLTSHMCVSDVVCSGCACTFFCFFQYGWELHMWFLDAVFLPLDTCYTLHFVDIVIRV